MPRVLQEASVTPRVLFLYCRRLRETHVKNTPTFTSPTPRGVVPPDIRNVLDNTCLSLRGLGPLSFLRRPTGLYLMHDELFLRKANGEEL